MPRKVFYLVAVQSGGGEGGAEGEGEGEGGGAVVIRYVSDGKCQERLGLLKCFTWSTDQ